jgi:glycosyltransferase involved in cell wall biosynthesis
MRLSIVLEWDNVLLSGTERARRGVESLFEQLRRLETVGPGTTPCIESVQLLVAYDSREIEPGAPERLLARIAAEQKASLQLEFVCESGSSYYQLKNLGFARATGDVVVILDSDVVPEPDWLACLLRPFDDPEVQVVGGASYIEPVDLYSRAFALGWFFPLRDETGELHEVNVLSGNNAAFRRGIVERFRFPDVPDARRGPGTLFERQLQQAGISILRCPGARVAHPPPARFVRRAISAGRDNLLRRRQIPGEGVTLRDSWQRVRARIARAGRRIHTMYRRVGLRHRQRRRALLVMTVYYSLYFVGDVLTRVAPRLMASRFRI